MPRARYFQNSLGRKSGNPLRFLVTGASGLLGSKVAQLASEKGHEVYSAYRQHRPPNGKSIQLDQTNETGVMETVSQIRPEVVVNTAAMTDVDQCEEQPRLALSTNADSVAYLARAAIETGALLVQVSTDYVFDGEKGWYSETDTTNPISQYGLSKLKGEEAAKLRGRDGWCIARASVVYGWGRSFRPNAATYVCEKLRRGEKVRIVRDQFSSPTLNTNLAKMLLEISERRIHGVIHTAGATRINRYDFARQIAKTMGLKDEYIVPIEVGSLAWRAKRPKDSSLNVAKALNVLAQRPLNIADALDVFKNEEKASRTQPA